MNDMSNKKQTAVEWLVDKLMKGEYINSSNELVEQAKQMEKEQIIDSYCQGCADITKDDSIFPREKSEQYYKETYEN